MAEFEFVPLVVVESAPWSVVVLGIVVVDDPPVVVVVDCAKANPVDSASAIAAAKRSRFMINNSILNVFRSPNIAAKRRFQKIRADRAG
ncbi:hypothetical protein [Mesorhizobium caraganae]|uniref:hypothetical protein n=1 Tax=Mesorhizobium caraganae TaxID=483206 RepID=UPI00333A5529